MSRYRQKPFIVEAVQWHKPGDHPAVEPREPVILFDRGGHYFYVQRYDDEMMKARSWLAVDLQGDVAQKNGTSLPFSFYELKSGHSVPIAERPDLYARYAAFSDMRKEPVTTGLLKLPSGSVSVQPGSWIIGPIDAPKAVLTDKAFHETYEPQEE